MKTNLFLFFFIFLSCGNVDCDEAAKVYRNGSCNIIVKDFPLRNSRHNFYIKGQSILTGKDTIYDEENRFYCLYYKYININDTIIKKKGESVFSIHKMDTVLKFYFECNNKIYK